MKTTSDTKFIGTPIEKWAERGRLGARNLFRFIARFTEALGTLSTPRCARSLKRAETRAPFNLIPALLLAAFLFGLAQTTFGQPSLTNGLVAYYPFDGNANDASGNANHGIVYGVLADSDRNGIPNASFKFTGLTNWIRLNIGPSVFTNTFTIALWVRMDDFTAGYPTIIDGDASCVNLIVAADLGYIGLGYYQKPLFAQASAQFAPEFGKLASANPFETNRWYHLAVVRNNLDFRIYVDGLLSAQKTESGSVSLSGSYLQVGNDFIVPSTNHSFHGNMDELRLYNRALSADEVQSLHSVIACTPVPSGLAAWWPGNGNGNDIQGTNNGTLVNGATFATGKVGQGFRLNGTSQYVSIPDSTSLSITGAITIEAWINPETFGSDRTIASQDNGQTGELGWFFGSTTDASLGLHFLVYGSGFSGYRGVTAPVSVIATGIFSHVAATFNPTNQEMKIYVNGAQLTNTQLYPGSSTVPSLFDSSAPILLGAYVPGGGLRGFFKGILDEVSLYNQSLSATEIQAIYSAGSFGKCSQGRPPSIIVPPATQIISLGTNLALTVTAVGTLPLSYQWRRNGTNLLAGTNFFGINTPSLAISNFQAAQFGAYSVLVSNIYGSIVSRNAILGLADAPDDDHDGIPNWWELAFGLDANNRYDATNNAPGDQLTYLQKYLYALDPLTSDTDNDGLSDYDELFVFGTNPLKTDTDGDGMPDGWEVQNGLNPRINDANDDADFDGLSNAQEYQYSLANTNAPFNPRNGYSRGLGLSDFEIFTGGQKTNRFFYDRNDRLLGLESSRGVSFAYVYDGNDNPIRQTVLSRAAETNGLPALWSFLNGLTNNTGLYADTDGDGWTDYQEWKSGSNPANALSTPNLLGNPGTNIASLALPFTPSNFVVGVGQLDGLGAEEIVLGGDGNPGTNANFLLVLTQTFSGWQTQRVDVGQFGITSIAVGQVTNRPSAGIYVGLRGTTNGSGRVMEFLISGGAWQSNVVALSTNQAAFVLGVAGRNVLASLAATNSPDGSLSAMHFATNWNLSLSDTTTSRRGLATLVRLDRTNQTPLRLLDSGGIQAGANGVSGMMAYYPFDGNANDTSGNDNNGTNNGVAWTNGVRIGAAEFNGTNAFIEASVFPDSTSYSAAAWLFIPSVDSTHRVIFQEGDTSAGYLLLGLAPANELQFFVKGVPSFLAYSGVPVGRWFHCAGVGDAESHRAQIWIDGVKVAEQTFSGQANVGYHSRLQIGRSFQNGSPQFYFRGKMDELRFYNRALTSLEIVNLASTMLTLPEPAATRTNNWRGDSLASGFLRGMHGSSVFYCFADDKNADGLIDFGDDFVMAEYLMGGTNASLLTLSRQPITSTSVAQSYGLASVNFLNASNEVFFTGEPDGQVFSWTATGTNPLQRQLFSAHHAGKAWHALAGVKTLEPGEGLVGLRVDPTNQSKCHLILWPPQSALPQLASLPQTAPSAAVLPQANPLGGLATVTVRLWDAEGNASSPFLQYQISGATNWQTATLTALNGAPYNSSTRLAALPTGNNHTVTWNAQANLGANVISNILLRARAQDFSLIGEWSAPTPFQIDTSVTTNPTNSPVNFTGITPVEGGITFNWQGGTNSWLYLQRSPAVAGTNAIWVNIWTGVPPTPITGSYTEPLGTNPIGFYRLKIGSP